MKLAAIYLPLLEQPIAGSSKKSAPNLAGEKEACSPFQQLLANMKTTAKDSEGNIFLAQGRSSSARDEKVGHGGTEEWQACLLFLLNGMPAAKQEDFSKVFTDDAIKQGNYAGEKEAIERILQQINNGAINISPRQLSSMITDQLASESQQDWLMSLLPDKVSKGNQDLRSFLQQLLEKWMEQAKGEEEVFGQGKKLDSSLLNRFSLSPGNFHKDFSSSPTTASKIERQNMAQLFPMSPLNGTMVTSQENIPVITVEQTLPEQQESESFLQQLTKVLQSSRFTRFQNGNAQLVIRLYPEHLGTLTVKVVREHGALTAKLIVSTDSAKELLDANLPQLCQMLDTGNITVEKWNVWTDERHTPGFYQGEREHGQKQQQQRKEEKLKKQPLSHFAVEMLDAEA
ncbi:flagellar hook-length control protein FliK [Saccharococcus thermophilus]|uniref:Flagellar hook-length control protein FliK n=1 Tax=Saccharococcus thermophilus TaxID=29396 RepID=A0A846MBE5_9BACL|nr:flagellar hook-length control protein FliK [Saccharococcus thermophilus]